MWEQKTNAPNLWHVFMRNFERISYQYNSEMDVSLYWRKKKYIPIISSRSVPTSNLLVWLATPKLNYLRHSRKSHLTNVWKSMPRRFLSISRTFTTTNYIASVQAMCCPRIGSWVVVHMGNYGRSEFSSEEESAVPKCTVNNCNKHGRLLAYGRQGTSSKVENACARALYFDIVFVRSDTLRQRDRTFSNNFPHFH